MELPDFKQCNGWIAVYPFSRMMLYIIFLSTLLICRMSGQDLRHFEVTKLNEGIYACVHKFGGEAICNSGVIDMGHYSLVIDPFMTPGAAQELLGWMKSAGLPPVRYVVNTHFHNDHVRGNQVFEQEVRIFSTARTADLIREEEPRAIAAESQYAEPLCRQFTALKGGYRGDTLHRQYQVFKMMQPYFCALARSQNEIQTRVPDTVFSQKLTLTGRHRVELLEMGAGHTPSDAVVYLPDAGILFAGDLLSDGFHPYIPDGNLNGWQNIVQKLEDMDVQMIIPGHGYPGGRELFRTTTNYLNHIESQARQILQANPAFPEDGSIEVPEAYQNWWLDQFYEQNIRFTIKMIRENKISK